MPDSPKKLILLDVLTLTYIIPAMKQGHYRYLQMSRDCKGIIQTHPKSVCISIVYIKWPNAMTKKVHIVDNTEMQSHKQFLQSFSSSLGEHVMVRLAAVTILSQSSICSVQTEFFWVSAFWFTALGTGKGTSASPFLDSQGASLALNGEALVKFSPYTGSREIELYSHMTV